MKIIGHTIKPRNPYAVAAKQRQAGAHGSYRLNKRQRQAEKQQLRRYLSGNGDDLQ